VVLRFVPGDQRYIYMHVQDGRCCTSAQSLPRDVEAIAGPAPTSTTALGGGNGDGGGDNGGREGRWR